MVSSKGLFYNDEKTKLLLNTENEQIPVAAQIFGNDIEAMSFAAKELSKTSPIIDINMGCPAPKVVKNGDGSKLLLNLELAGNIIEAVVKNSQVPVTLKMRKGWDDNNIVAVELAKIAEEKPAKHKNSATLTECRCIVQGVPWFLRPVRGCRCRGKP